MKALNRYDLILLLCSLDNERIFEDDIKKLFEMYGDDWFIEGNEWKRATKNPLLRTMKNSVYGKVPK